MRKERSDVFRFMAIREPDKVSDVDAARIDASGNGEDTSAFLQMLNDANKQNSSLAAIVKIASDYVNNKLRDDATVYASSLKSLDAKLSDLGVEIHSKSSKDKISIVKSEVARLKITDENLTNWKSRLNDSFNAALILRKERGADLRSIERAIRSLHVISRVKSGAISDDKSIADALTKTITVSKSIVSRISAEKSPTVDDENTKQNQENAERVKKAVEEYDGNRTAIKELTTAYDKDWEMRRLLQREEAPPATEAQEIPAVYSGIFQKAGRWLGLLPVSEKVSIPASKPHKNRSNFQSILAQDISKNISQQTKDRLEAIGSSSEKIEATFAIARLEELNLDIANNLHSEPTSTVMTRFGEYSDSVGDHADEAYYDPDAPPIKFPAGDCPASSKDAPIKKGDYAPKFCRFNSLGIGELQVVKQKLIGYEIGEIAHIENVMASEKRSRNHRTLHRTEEFTSYELEREEETERDLETTTRFELQKEIDKEVQESTQKEAGLTVSGTYGVSVEFSANAGIATDSSSSKTENLSTSYSKEKIDRSVHRIQEKIKEKRTMLTIDEVEVINKHSFKNQEAGAEHINGIYSWVNKKYEAQVFNYGKRELIEVIIPEPAAFVRYLETHRPKKGSTISKPLKPGYCVRGRFIPLSPGTLTIENYLNWVKAYNIQDIEPPPPATQLVSDVLNSEAEAPQPLTTSDSLPRAVYINLVKKEVKIPPGYIAKKAWFSQPQLAYYTKGEVAIGRQLIPLRFLHGEGQVGETTVEVILDNEREFVPIAVSLSTFFNFAATIEVECKRTNRALMEWQISTFNAIMNRYEILMEEYEEAISGEENFGSVDIQGKNPIENQKIILNELKRQVITQMTGQTFDEFDAMQENVGEYGYPEQDVDEAFSEGQEIRFVEQAFEWENLQYLFYPYYWGKKKDWPITSRLEDTDPLFQAFLQAGSCRLNIAVRPGFVTAVNTYLSTGCFPWDSKEEGPTIIPCLDIDDEEEEAADSMLSITEEMRAQQGAVYFKSEGTLSYVVGDPEAQLTGENASFEDDDVNREINIAGEIYMIKSVNIEQQTIVLDEEIGPTLQGVTQFSIGAKAIGVPWIVTIPTSLVILGDGSDLPEIPE
tara:strand:+ start:725 stop:4054 length:3330 start_codon:yes stop_codon:yes gene_type:complete